MTFKTISEAFNTELNKSSAGATIASLTYKEGRVTLYIKPDTQLFNVRMADDIARELKIKPDRPNTGELVDADKIAFHNVDSIFMTCDQARSRTFIDSREAETILASTSFDAEVEVTSFEASKNPTPFHAPVGQLTFCVQDKLGNKLPVKKLFCRLRINDECLRRKEKIYPLIPTATAPPDDDNQAYRLKKIDELEKFLRSEVDLRDKLTKRFKRRATATSISDTAVIAAITALEATSIATSDYRYRLCR